MMARVKPGPFRSALLQFSGSRPGAWLYARGLPQFDRLFFKLSGGRAMLTSLAAGLPMALLTSTGARSGRPRVSPLVCIRGEAASGRFALIASNWGQPRHPAWYFNLKANPKAQCSIDGQSGQYTAREAEGEEYERYWGRAVEMNSGYLQYKQRLSGRRIPIMVMTPT